ncbi:hypothetical protein QQF64_020618 [Cirrhinus molitorella]|uniref:Uncharacterized protein n=1 Tax=Cirrhinus molitorella TaxID=172907 RepID=A0ABR3L9Y3_9TELE
MASKTTLSQESKTKTSKSCVSMKSGQSVDEPTNFSSGDSPAVMSKSKPSCVSMKSDQSVDEPTNFKSGDSAVLR